MPKAIVNNNQLMRRMEKELRDRCCVGGDQRGVERREEGGQSKSRDGGGRGRKRDRRIV